VETVTGIVVIGINHKTASVDLREKLSFTENELARFFALCKERGDILDCVVLSTCNRTEVYVACRDEEASGQAVTEMLAAVKEVEADDVRSGLYIYTREKAVEHLFSVTAGLDSMILGETQILGQVKEAYNKACAADMTGNVFHVLFRQAITAAKRVQTETGINQKAASISYAAVELAKKIFGRLQDHTVMVLGAGKMSELTLRHLYDQGVRRVIVVNRTKAHADQLAASFGGISEYYEKRRECLIKADIVISSTRAPHFVLGKEEMSQVMRRRCGRPLFLIDIAVPRDVDPQVKELENVFLFNIDDLQEVVAANLRERKHEAERARQILREEINEFQVWVKIQEVVPLIAALRQKAEAIRQAELGTTFKRLSNLSEKEKKHIDNLTRAIVNRILREPLLRIKQVALDDNSDKFVDLLCHLFDLKTEAPEISRTCLQVVETGAEARHS
jgi:glutamyl-tRNA reductase